MHTHQLTTGAPPVSILLFVLALVCFILAQFPIRTRINWIALGLTFWVLTFLLGAFHQ